MSDWQELDEWWLDEVDDPAYAEEVLPLIITALDAQPGGRYLDLGCGEGRVMAALHRQYAAGDGPDPSHPAGRDRAAIDVIGVDININLLRRAAVQGPVVADRLPNVASIADDAVDGAFVVLALEHIEDEAALFAATARVVRPDGVLAVVLNHPVYTAPESGPVLDPTDGEIYWRFGGYFEQGSTVEPAGGRHVEFVHRSMATLLNGAAAHGWSLEHMEERGVGAAAAARDPLLARHGDIPHLLAVRWRLHAPADPQPDLFVDRTSPGPG
jgi:SAM-dependent methyltransferase